MFASPGILFEARILFNKDKNRNYPGISEYPE
jgi:hypothetical protein